MAYVSPDEPIYTDPDLQTGRLPVASVWVLREGYCQMCIRDRQMEVYNNAIEQTKEQLLKQINMI